MIEQIGIGDMAFIAKGSEGIGAVRSVQRHKIVIYVENAGEFDVPVAAIQSVMLNKVMLDPAQLDSKLLKAVRHAHDAEDPRLTG